MIMDYAIKADLHQLATVETIQSTQLNSMYASLVESGASLKELQDAMGHLKYVEGRLSMLHQVLLIIKNHEGRD